MSTPENIQQVAASADQHVRGGKLFDATSDDTTSLTKTKEGRTLVSLTPGQLVLASVALFLWLNLFAGGMLVDTRPYRCAISWAGVEAVIPATFKDHPCQAYWPASQGVRVFNRYGLPSAALDEQTAQLPVQPPPFGDGAKAWLMALIFYTPLNLAFISAAAGALGSLGSIANLNNDSDPDAASRRDRTNPLISGLLRGMFVYLFMISGMLLFDDSPFSATGPDQYVRLAGFLSLFSFVVNYQPNIFGTLIEWANNRIQSKNGSAGTAKGTKGEIIEAKAAPGGDARFFAGNGMIGAIVESPDAPTAAGQPVAHDADAASRNGHSAGNGTGNVGG